MPLRTLRLGVLLLWSSVAVAQGLDSLTCFKAKDSQRFEAEVSLATVEARFDPSGSCKVVGKAKLFCLPTTKTVHDFTVDGVPGELLDLGAVGPVSGSVCYKVRCPKGPIGPAQVTDEFGSRDLSKFKAQLLCTPALITSAVCGNGVVEPGEACDDGNVAGGDCCSAACDIPAEDGTPCDDGDACTAGDQCSGGTCTGAAVGDGYEPNDTSGQATDLGMTDDSSGFPAITVTPTLSASDVDWFRLYISDGPGTLNPRAALTLGPGQDGELFMTYLCGAGTTSLECTLDTTACVVDGLQGCCASGAGSFTFLGSPDCGGLIGDNSGTLLVQVRRASGAVGCAAYTLALGDD